MASYQEIEDGCRIADEYKVAVAFIKFCKTWFGFFPLGLQGCGHDGIGLLMRRVSQNCAARSAACFQDL